MTMCDLRSMAGGIGYRWGKRDNRVGYFTRGRVTLR